MEQQQQEQYEGGIHQTTTTTQWTTPPYLFRSHLGATRPGILSKQQQSTPEAQTAWAQVNEGVRGINCRNVVPFLLLLCTHICLPLLLYAITQP